MQDIIIHLIYDVCTLASTDLLCSGILSEYASEVVNVIIDRELDSNLVCGSLMLCEKTYQKETVQKYVKEILADKTNLTAPTPSGKKTYKILHLTDVHVDLEYTTVISIFKFFLTFLKGSSRKL